MGFRAWHFLHMHASLRLRRDENVRRIIREFSVLVILLSSRILLTFNKASPWTLTPSACVKTSRTDQSRPLAVRRISPTLKYPIASSLASFKPILRPQAGFRITLRPTPWSLIITDLQANMRSLVSMESVQGRCTCISSSFLIFNA